ncbi:MAG TPA: tRNA lysidine(34) synthetase TilS [Armatimonadota bacterium]|nr:tRNA lysidine(34) synthetase TilS [Armatimonadota bacterium]
MHALLNTRLFDPGDRVLVGVSGGADSLALLHMLAAARTTLLVELVAAHVHHEMRGDAADADVEFLRNLCGEWRIAFDVERCDVPALARERRVSVEEAGRDARYAAFELLARRHRCGKVATAHHADDQAETVLLNLFRGAGIDGLAGIPPRRPLWGGASSPEVVRPLLGTWRHEIDAYCRAHDLQPREDVTNLDLRYRRSRIRHELLPVLRHYDPAIAMHLVRLSTQAREERELLDPAAEALLASAAQHPPPARSVPLWLLARQAVAPLRLDGEVVAAAPPALARRALRLALRRVGGHAVEIDAALVERLLELCSGRRRTALDLPGCGLRAYRTGGVLVLGARPAEPTPPPHSLEVAVPGSTPAPAWRLCLAITAVPPPDDPRCPPDQACIDEASVRPPLRLRSPATGDRLQPLGAPGTRLLSDVLTDRKIQRELRATWPILADQEGILWVVGLAVVERARVGAQTRQCLHLAVSPLEAGSGAPSEQEAGPVV